MVKKKKKNKAADEAATAPGKRKAESAVDPGEPGKKQREQSSAVGNSTAASTAAVVKPQVPEDGPPEDAYRAAAVVFFTRDKQGKLDKVLLAVEERKVAASFLGLEQKGKVTERLVVFPMGRKEKKDKNDAVETVKREYIEETLDYGKLARYLDFADFEGLEEGDSRCASLAPGDPVPATWTGAKNMALRFVPACMTVLFCEVPGREADACRLAENEKHQRETEAQLKAQSKPSPTYHIGKVGHVECHWLSAEELRKVAGSSEKSPALQLGGQTYRCFPTTVSLVRLSETRQWLGLPEQKQT